ncbi:MAG: hypothetical protein JWQ50_4824 [Caballeronia mineralivorans]|nr:hypothetical protein [Caballeronia mineralivorans]
MAASPKALNAMHWTMALKPWAHKNGIAGKMAPTENRQFMEWIRWDISSYASNCAALTVPRLRCAGLQRITPETPFEGACRLIALADKLLGALAQMRDAGVAGMAQHTAGVEGKP